VGIHLGLPPSAQMASSSGFDLCASVKHFAQVCHSVTDSEMKTMSRLCEAGKAYLQARARDLVVGAGNLPVLVHYSSDGTPISTKYRAKAARLSNTGTSVKREGRETSEFLVQVGFARRIDPNGKTITACILRDPVPLVHGKSAWSLFSCGREFFPTARQQGHVGISIAHYAFDRAAYNPLQRTFRQYHAALASQFADPSRGFDSAMLEKMEWIVSSGCALHDCHNSLKWALHSHFQDTSLMEDVYIVVAAVRNSYGLVHSHLGKWLDAHLAFVPDADCPSAQELQALWTVLGLEPELVETLCSLRLHWASGKLNVAASCASREALVEELSAVLLGIWHFKQFTTSRWVTVGCSCRSLLGALLTGFDALVEMIRANPAASDFNISGYGRLGHRAKRFIAMAALVSYVPEACLLQLLQDNRLPLQLGHLKSTMVEELRFLDGIEPKVWQALAGACGMAPLVLQSEVLAAGHIAFGFMHRRAFSEAGKLPWSLGVGDIEQNLAQLKQGPEPSDATSSKIWHLLHMGYNMAQLKQGVQLLMDAPWGTSSAEQLHASATIFRKFHPEYGTETLMVRAFLHSLRLLMPGLSQEEKQLAAQARKVTALLSHKPQHIAGRQVFVKDLMSVAASWKQEGRALPPNVQQSIMKRHGKTWGKLEPGAKAKYENRAALQRATSEQELGERIAQESESLALMAARLREQQGSLPLLLSQCKLSSQEIGDFSALCHSPAFADKEVKNRRARARAAPPPPDDDFKRRLGSFDVAEEQVETPRPAWLTPCCWNRALFANVVLRFSGVAGNRFYRFLFATQSPLYACFCEIKEAEYHVPTGSASLADWASGAVDDWSHHFSMDFEALTHWYELPQAHIEGIHVLPDVHLLGGGQLVSGADYVPLGVFLTWLPPAKQAQTRTPKADTLSTESGLLAKYPWMTKFVQEGAAASPSGATSSKADPILPIEEEPEALDDDQVQAVFQALEQTRQAWDLHAPSDHADFRITLLGGAWHQRHKGTTYVAFQGAVRKNSPSEQWCIQYNLPKSARFEISLYGESGAHTMANAWCHRLNFLFSLYEAYQGTDFTYPANCMAGYEEPPEFASFAEASTRAQLARVQWLRSLLPR
jgi:hypothetical protein